MFQGNSGDDTIEARDDEKDRVRGHTGFDRCFVDPIDDVSGCEVKVFG